MFQIKNKLERKKLLGVISVYEGFVMYHPALKTKLGAGRFLNAKSLKKIFNFLEGKREFISYSFSEFIPENVLNYNSENGSLLFWTAPQRRNMLFSGDFIKSTDYNLPALLWRYDGKSLSVFALKGSKKPKPNDFVYHAPFLNVNGQGRVCMGNVDFINRTGSLDKFPDILQDLFFNSLFTHTNNNTLAKVNIHKAYEMALSPKFVWDDILVKTKIKISELKWHIE